jgi:hypothetical protein
MGKLAADLDAEALQHRNAYYMALANGNYEHAMHTVVMLNKSIRPSNRVQEVTGKDLAALNRTSYYTFKDELVWLNDCKTWCFRYAPLVQDAFAREREALLREYDR